MTAWVRVLVAGGAILTGPCVEAAQGDVGVFTSSERGGSARSYWVEGDRGIVLIGTQLLVSEAERFVRDAEARSGKKAVMALVLAPTPEQFNGTSTLQKRGIKVYTSEQIAQRIPAVFAQAKTQVAASIKADYPPNAPKPVSFGDANQKMLIAGLPLKLLVLGPAASEAHVAVSYETHLFCGELVAGPVHPALGAGNLADWLKRLQELRADAAAPGLRCARRAGRHGAARESDDLLEAADGIRGRRATAHAIRSAGTGSRQR